MPLLGRSFRWKRRRFSRGHHVKSSAFLFVDFFAHLIEGGIKRPNGVGVHLWWRLGLVDLAHDALPGAHGAVVHLAQLVVGLYVQRPHEMLHIELVGAPRSFAFLLGEPDLFLGDIGELGEG
jgi:hypothetical protein